MDGSAYDQVSGVTIVGLWDKASNCQHTNTADRVPLSCQTDISDNVPIARTHRLNSRRGQPDCDVSIEMDVASTAANMSSAKEDAVWCWNGACTRPHCAGLQHQRRAIADGAHIFINATSGHYKECENYLFRDMCDSGLNNVSETAEIVCDYTSVCDDENIFLDANIPLVYGGDPCNVMDSEIVACQKTEDSTPLNEHYTASNDMGSFTVCSDLCDNTTNLSGATVSERTCSDTTLVSTVEAVYVASLMNQKSSLSECLLPEDRDLVHDVQQPPSAVCVPPPGNSTKVSELPPVSFPPIFYISMDKTLPLNLCATEKQNAVLKSELPNINPRFAERCDSQLSTLSEKQDICRICHCEAELSNKLISPCLCSGSLKYIHLCCLQKWIKSSDKKSCELCNFDYIMTMKIRPFKQWERLDMTVAERRKIVCSVTFHIIAITCVIWSLYVLIDRTTEEVNAGTLDWPFWTKLIVVAIGFTGGLVFMYVQCKMYLQLCLRWRQYNKLINIENAPEDVHLRAEAAARIKARSNEAGGIVNTVALQEVDSL